MTVQELIKQLMKIEDKTSTVSILSEFGRGCFSKSNDVRVSEDEGEVCIYGEETSNDSEDGSEDEEEG